MLEIQASTTKLDLVCPFMWYFLRQKNSLFWKVFSSQIYHLILTKITNIFQALSHLLYVDFHYSSIYLAFSSLALTCFFLPPWSIRPINVRILFYYLFSIYCIVFGVCQISSKYLVNEWVSGRSQDTNISKCGVSNLLHVAEVLVQGQKESITLIIPSAPFQLWQSESELQKEEFVLFYVQF